MNITSQLLDEIKGELNSGMIVPYLGPGVLELVPNCPVPSSPDTLVELLVATVSVPHKIRKNLTAAAQFIENFKHRKTLTGLMADAFKYDVEPTALHRYLAALPKDPMLIVDAWYDNAMEIALRGRRNPGQVQGASQSEHFGTWVQYFRSDGSLAEPMEADTWDTILYQPWGSNTPARNFLVSDTDFVEVLTEIDIQTPIPDVVQHLRTGRHFLFMGCRFRNQLERTFARQIMKRSSDKHWAVLHGELTRNEARFMEEQKISRIDMPLAEFVEALASGQTVESMAAVG